MSLPNPIHILLGRIHHLRHCLLGHPDRRRSRGIKCNELRTTKPRSWCDARRNHFPVQQHDRLRGTDPRYNTPTAQKGNNTGFVGGMAGGDIYVCIDLHGADSQRIPDCRAVGGMEGSFDAYGEVSHWFGYGTDGVGDWGFCYFSSVFFFARGEQGGS